MNHIESSKLIKLGSAADATAVKYSFVERLRGAFYVETVGEGVESFAIAMSGKGMPCRCAINVVVRTDAQNARIMVDGTSQINTSTKILYVLGVLALLILGLFPGSTINTSGHGSAMDVMVFLFLGMFVLFDVNKKLAEPELLIDRILNALNVEFGV